jgi:hypothetical protein
MSIDWLDPQKWVAAMSSVTQSTVTAEASSSEEDYASVPRRQTGDNTTQQLQKLHGHISDFEQRAQALDNQIAQTQQQAVQYKMAGDNTSVVAQRTRCHTEATKLMGKIRALQEERMQITLSLQTLEQRAKEFKKVRDANLIKNITHDSTRGLETDMAGLQMADIKTEYAAARLVSKNVAMLDDVVFNPFGLDAEQDAQDLGGALDALVKEYQQQAVPSRHESAVPTQLPVNTTATTTTQRTVEEIYNGLRGSPVQQQQQKRPVTYQSLY